MNKPLAKELLFDFYDVFKKQDITFFLDCGTLLSAVREKDFIDYDDDLDIGTFINIPTEYSLWKKVLQDFSDREIKIVTAWDDSVFSIRKKGELTADIHTYKKVGTEYQIEMKNVLFFFPEECFNTLDKIMFLEREFNIPHNSEQWLSMMYGDDWRTPNRDRKGWTSKYTRPLPYKTLMSFSRNIPLF